MASPITSFHREGLFIEARQFFDRAVGVAEGLKVGDKFVRFEPSATGILLLLQLFAD